MDTATCVDCAEWFGCCHSERRDRRLKYGRVASSEACDMFRPKRRKEQAEVPA